MTDIIGDFVLDTMRVLVAAMLWGLNSSDYVSNAIGNLLIDTGNLIAAAAVANIWGWPIFGFVALRCADEWSANRPD